MPGRVVVLGCGPAGLVAAHAATLLGREVIVLSRKIRSPLHGSQYLHAPIPHMTVRPPDNIVYRLYGGSYAAYQRKAHGPGASVVGLSSEPEQEQEFAESRVAIRSAWDMRQTYDALWTRYNLQIRDWEFDAFHKVSYALYGLGKVDRVYSTIPLPLLCQYPGTHIFDSSLAWAAGEAPELGIVFDGNQAGGPVNWPTNEIGYWADRHVSWYRTHDVYGHRSIEWPGHLDKPYGFPTASQVRRPLWTNCDCWPSIVKLGRYGAWNRSQLVNHVFDAVTKDLSKES